MVRIVVTGEVLIFENVFKTAFTGTLINYHFFVNTNTTAMFRIAFSSALSCIINGFKSGLALWGLVVLLGLLGMTPSVSAQRVMTTKGIDFWFGYMNNNITTAAEGNPLQLGIYLSYTSQDTKKPQTSVTIRVPGKNFEKKITLPANVITEFRFDRDQSAVQAGIIKFLEEANSNVIDQKAINVSSEDSINVFIMNRRNYTMDNTVVFHSGVIGSKYIVGSYGERFKDGTPSKSEFMIVAKYDTTIIDITPTADIIDDGPDGIRRRAGIKFTITLNQGETYLAMSNGDLTGTTVQVPISPNGITERCTPFALFGGNQCTNVGSIEGTCDHLFQQILPLPNLENPLERSREFILMGHNRRSEDVYRIVKLTDNPTVLTLPRDAVDQTPVNIPANKKYHDLKVVTAGKSKGFLLKSNEPIAVYHLGMSRSADPGTAGRNGDPFMLAVPPVELMRRDTAQFAVFQFPNLTNVVWNHLVNVYCRKADTANLKFFINNRVLKDSLKLNEAYLSQNERVVAKYDVDGSDEYVVYVLELNNVDDVGTYQVTSTQGIFTVSYGFAWDDSYGYLSSLSFIATPNVETRIATKVNIACENAPTGEASFEGVGGQPYEFTDDEGYKGYFYRVALKKQNPRNPADSLRVGELMTFDRKDNSKKVYIKDIVGHVTIQGGTRMPCKDTVMHYLAMNSGDFLAVVNQYKGCEQYHRFTIGSLLPLKIPSGDTVCRFVAQAVIGDSIPANQGIWWCTDPPNLTIDSTVVDSKTRKYFIPMNQPAIANNPNLEMITVNAYRKTYDGSGTYGKCDDADACVKTVVITFSKEPKLKEIILRTDPGKGSGDTLFVPKPTGRFTPEVLIDKLSAGYLPADSADKANLIYKWDFGVESIQNDTSRNESDSWIYPDDQLKGDELKTYEVTLTIMEKGAEGCSATAKKRVYIIIPKNYMIKVPNVFTPNGDGFNEKVIIENFGIDKFEMVIYDRWGMEVYRGKDINNGWDGKVNSGSKDASEGQYFWVIQAKTVTDLEITRTGSITLLR